MHSPPWLFHGFKYYLSIDDHHIMSLVQTSFQSPDAYILLCLDVQYMSQTKLPVSPKACSMLTFHISLNYSSALLAGRSKGVLSTHLISNLSRNPISLNFKINPASFHFSPSPFPFTTTTLDIATTISG